MDLSEKSAASNYLQENALMASLRNVYSAFSEHREALGLSNPGTVEKVASEVQRDVFLNNSMFTGLRADITRAHGYAPMFQTSHAFAMGSQALPPYTFSATFGTPKV